MTTEEFKTEVLPIKNKLYRFALRLLGDTEEAQDIVQEIFLKLWSRKDILREYRSIEAFAMTMTRNLCYDKIKSPSSKKDTINESTEMTEHRTPYQETELSDTMKLVYRAMEGLPEQQKMVIHLRDIEQCDFDEIAEVTGLSMNNVRVQLSRARKKIREALIKLNNYEFSKN
jgi:RNA polymerase sigma-70 factor (ECF subfamily)